MPSLVEIGPVHAYGEDEKVKSLQTDERTGDGLPDQKPSLELLYSSGELKVDMHMHDVPYRMLISCKLPKKGKKSGINCNLIFAIFATCVLSIC